MGSCCAKKNGAPHLALPFVIDHRYGIKRVVLPQLTQAIKIWMANGSDDSINIDDLTELFSMISTYKNVNLNRHYEHKNLLPLHWIGFAESCNYTYLINDISDPNSVFNDFSSSARNKVRKAQKIVKLVMCNDTTRFYKLSCMTFARQGLANPFDLYELERHDKALEKKNQRQMFFAVDADGRDHSALYLTWDSRSAYVHLVGENPNLRASGAGIFLINESIKFASSELGLKLFDFEGSMIESIEQVRRSCAGVQTPFSAISKTSMFLGLIQLSRSLRR